MPDSPELTEVLNLLSKKQKLTVMLAPSFPIDFSYPEIIGKLKRAGFAYVVEVAAGASETNKQAKAELAADPKKRMITSPCPSCVRFIRAQYPQLKLFLSKADSPMRATAKMVKEKYPDTRPVFIGPCLTKKLEAQEYPDLNILVLTYKEIVSLFEKLKLKDSSEDFMSGFDLLEQSATRLYPISGGLAKSAKVDKILTEQEYRVVSGLHLLKEALQEFESDKKIRLLDILFCDGGCVSGPGIVSQAPLEKRREAVVRFWATHMPEKKG